MYAQEKPLLAKSTKKSETIVVYSLEKHGVYPPETSSANHPSIQSNSINDASRDISLSHTFSALCTPADARQIAVTWSLNNICVVIKMKTLRLFRDYSLRYCSPSASAESCSLSSSSSVIRAKLAIVSRPWPTSRSFSAFAGRPR